MVDSHYGSLSSPAPIDSRDRAPWKPGIIARFFAKMVTASLQGQTSDVRAIRTPPDFRVEVWPNMGEMPVPNINDRTLALRIAAFRVAFEQLQKLPRPSRRWPSIEVADRAARELYGALFPAVAVPDPTDLSDWRLFEQITVGGFYDLQAQDDGTHCLDLRFLTDFPVRDGFLPYGGQAFVDFERKEVVSLTTAEGRTFRPGDRGWGFAACRFRASLFAYLTFIPHSVWSHGIVAPKLFIATHRLPQAHPLHTLLRPFVHDVHKNVARAKITVFGATGVLTAASCFTDASVQLLLVRGQSHMAVKLLDELALPDDLREQLTPTWEALRTCAQGFIDTFSISDDDPLIAEFHRYLALNVHARLADLPLVDVITYLVFTSTVAHHLWGHIYYGTTDPTYVSGTVRPRWHESAMIECCEPADVTLMRLGVIVSVRREYIKLASDFGCTTDDEQAKRLFAELADTLRRNEQRDARHRIERVASSGML